VATEKRSSTSKELRSDAKRQRSRARKAEVRAEKAEARADRWKARATGYQEEAAELRGQLKKVTKRLDKARRSGPGERPADDVPAKQGVEQSVDVPDASWTVARLRAEARARGLTGVTTKPKAELLELLASR
jgi:hypothetical protein